MPELPDVVVYLESLERCIAGRLRWRESHTLKRALTDPRLFSGIGNAYSDEILHRARLSPFKLTGKLDDEEIARLHEAIRAVLLEWIARSRDCSGATGPRPSKNSSEGAGNRRGGDAEKSSGNPDLRGIKKTSLRMPTGV
jgi:formamidopyrimidine-DNA glycosylase